MGSIAGTSAQEEGILQGNWDPAGLRGPRTATPQVLPRPSIFSLGLHFAPDLGSGPEDLAHSRCLATFVGLVGGRMGE